MIILAKQCFFIGLGFSMLVFGFGLLVYAVEVLPKQ